MVLPGTYVKVSGTLRTFQVDVLSWVEEMYTLLIFLIDVLKCVT